MEEARSLPKVMPEESACQVCGDSLKNKEDITLCGKCQTPHHSGCFKYNGGCAVYGCGKKEANQKSSPGNTGMMAKIKWSNGDYAVFTIFFLLTAILNDVMEINQASLLIFLVLCPSITTLLKVIWHRKKTTS